MAKKPKYTCIRCAYSTEYKTNMHKHLYLKNLPCPQTENNIELTDEIKEHILNNRIYNIPQNFTKNESILVKQIEKLKIDICMIKFHKHEQFYQIMVEKFLNGTHMTLPSGVTDVSTDTIHAEIKNWSQFKFAVGQLMCYNDDCPKEKLQAYLFGKATQKMMKIAYEKFTKFNIEVFTFMTDGNTFRILKYDTNEIVYTMTVENE